MFVNPLQFGPSEDFAPIRARWREDERLLREAHCDLLFAPPVEADLSRRRRRRRRVVQRARSGEILDGPFRPGHFDGVATVVAKLFRIVAARSWRCLEKRIISSSW